jgi:hypothetical protein
MAVQVTGFFQNPQTKLIYQNPILQLVPHLEYPGKINMDVNMDVSVSSQSLGSFGSVSYTSIDRSSLSYNSQIADPYDRLIDALENFVLADLQNSNDINKNSTFTKYVPQSGSLG